MTDYIWRCSGCGKWSHALKKPKYHERGTQEPEGHEHILRSEYGGYDGEDYYFVACGPFDTYEVRKIYGS